MLLTPTTSTSSHAAITERLSYYYHDCETETHFHIPYQPKALTIVLPVLLVVSGAGFILLWKPNGPKNT